MMLYKIMLTLFIFGLVCGAINESGIYDHPLPTSDPQITQADVEDFAGQTGDGLNFFFVYTAIATSIRVLGGAILSCITILPLMYSLGVPVWLGMVVQGPIWLITIWGIYEFKTGHQTMGMD